MTRQEGKRNERPAMMYSKKTSKRSIPHPHTQKKMQQQIHSDSSPTPSRAAVNQQNLKDIPTIPVQKQRFAWYVLAIFIYFALN